MDIINGFGQRLGKIDDFTLNDFTPRRVINKN